MLTQLMRQENHSEGNLAHAAPNRNNAESRLSDYARLLIDARE
jgi:hypothetical protein